MQIDASGKLPGGSIGWIVAVAMILLLMVGCSKAGAKAAVGSVTIGPGGIQGVLVPQQGSIRTQFRDYLDEHPGVAVQVTRTFVVKGEWSDAYLIAKDGSGAERAGETVQTKGDGGVEVTFDKPGDYVISDETVSTGSGDDKYYGWIFFHCD